MNSILIGLHKKLGNIGKVDAIFIQWLLVLTGLRFRRRLSRRCGDLKHSCHGVRISRMQSRTKVASLVVIAAASIKHDDDEALMVLGSFAMPIKMKECYQISAVVKRSWRMIHEQIQSRIVDWFVSPRMYGMVLVTRDKCWLWRIIGGYVNDHDFMEEMQNNGTISKGSSSLRSKRS